MRPPGAGHGLAIASLVLGLLGLLTAGGCGIGALVGFALGVTALVRAQRDPAVYAGRDVAWAGIVTNVLAVMTIGPIVILLGVLNSAGSLPRISGDEELPEPHSASRRDGLLVPVPPSVAPPPPPPPPASAVDSAPSATAEQRPSDGAVRVGGAIREPTKLKHVSPVYPEIAKQARVQGVVILEATISPSGKVETVRVLRGAPLLDQAAVDAVKQWEYTPTLLNDVPVPVIMTVTVRFRLQ